MGILVISIYGKDCVMIFKTIPIVRLWPIKPSFKKHHPLIRLSIFNYISDDVFNKEELKTYYGLFKDKGFNARIINRKIRITGDCIMPVITIKSKDSERKPELQKFAEEISIKTGIAVSRIQVIAEYYSAEDFFTNNVHAIISISISEKNDKNTIQELMQACASIAAKHFSVEENQIAVTAYPVGTGYLFVNNHFI
jgi:hypothetical protein